MRRAHSLWWSAPSCVAIGVVTILWIVSLSELASHVALDGWFSAQYHHAAACNVTAAFVRKNTATSRDSSDRSTTISYSAVWNVSAFFADGSDYRGTIPLCAIESVDTYASQRYPRDALLPRYPLNKTAACMVAIVVDGYVTIEEPWASYMSSTSSVWCNPVRFGSIDDYHPQWAVFWPRACAATTFALLTALLVCAQTRWHAATKHASIVHAPLLGGGSK